MTQFSDLKLDPKVLKAIDEAGYTTPTPIQAGAIPPALDGRDVLGIAQTGTGKTASFTLPMITLLGRGRARARMPRSLVLCPTRELAAQVAENFDIYAKHTRLTKALLIGGVSMRDQEMLIDRGVDVLIATPGRLLDHFERGNLLLQGVQIMVVDEADRMLDMGFIPDIERIFQLTPFTRQTLFFSATMAPEIERITNTFLNAPERIEVARQATTSETITQKLVELTPTRKDQTAKQKRQLLRALIDAEGPADQEGGLKNAIIFCNRKTEVDIVAKSLKAHGYDAAPIHGDLDQRQRTATLEGFRDGSLRFLIASDVAARGLDIPAVSHVFNFDLPSHAEDYVHRIGRTGRAGRRGTAYSIATPADEKYLAAIENLVKHDLPRGELPEGFVPSESGRGSGSASGRGDRDGRGDRSGSDRSSSRTRSRNRKSAAPADNAALPEPVEAAQDSARVDVPEGGDRTRSADRSNGREDRAESRGEGRRGGRREDRRDDRREDRRDDRRDDRREDRRDRGRDRDRGPAVMGMGDHVPDFLLTSFRTTDGAPAEKATEKPADKPAPQKARAKDTPKVEAEAPVAVPVPEPVTEPVTVADAPATDMPLAEAPAADVAATDMPAEAAAPEKPPAKRRTRARKTAAKAVPAADAPAADATDAAVVPAADAEPAPEAEAKPKPKRAPRSRKKKDAPAPEASAEAGPEVGAGAAAPAKLPEEVEAERGAMTADAAADTTTGAPLAADQDGPAVAQPDDAQG